ncbi:zinc finger protein 816-like [Mercenaria mercenaria]|uniref:zinc finger protein 816-like n=1 Tax=Mercenaria mercenaria TaxID=6596 RepID=UPI00234F2AE0|nr:zinc finger protein 816-like [Mercenaria mercenaria]
MFQCSICGLKLKTERGFNYHMKEQCTVKKCSICNRVFKSKRSLGEHVRQVHHYNTYTCQWCGASFRNRSTLNGHKLRHISCERFSCGLCSETFSSKAIRRRHRKQVHGVFLHDCSNCDMSFKAFAALNFHRKYCLQNVQKLPRNSNEDCDQTQSVDHRCKICQKRFLCKEELNDHVLRHPLMDFVMAEGGGFVCILCPEYRTRQQWQIWKHVRGKHFVKQHLCNICGKLFHKKCTLRDHLLTHSKHGSYKCSICSAEYRTSVAFLRHIKLHGALHNCSVCNSAFALREELARHEIKCHTAYSRFTCYVCGRQFLHMPVFRNHLFQHNHKRLLCTVCFEAFDEAGDVEEHQSREHTKCRKCKLWQMDKNIENVHFKVAHLPHCKVCSNIFPTRKSLKQHLKLVHKVGVETKGPEPFTKTGKLKKGLKRSKVENSNIQSVNSPDLVAETGNISESVKALKSEIGNSNIQCDSSMDVVLEQHNYAKYPDARTVFFGLFSRAPNRYLFEYDTYLEHSYSYALKSTSLPLYIKKNRSRGLYPFKKRTASLAEAGVEEDADRSVNVVEDGEEVVENESIIVEFPVTDDNVCFDPPLL